VVICATQKCGSTLVCNDFLNNGIGKPKEHFLGLIKNPSIENADNRLNQIIKAGLNEQGIFSVKLMSSYSDKIDGFLINSGHGQKTNKFWGGISSYFHDASWIYIKRDSLLRQAVSRFMSKRTGINHAISNQANEFIPGNYIVGQNDNYNEKVKYSKQHLNKNIINIAKENFLWERFFLENNIIPTKINYEEISNSIAYILRMFRAVGLPDTDLVEKRNLLKLSNYKTNYKTDEIIQSFMNEAS